MAVPKPRDANRRSIDRRLPMAWLWMLVSLVSGLSIWFLLLGSLGLWVFGSLDLWLFGLCCLAAAFFSATLGPKIGSN